MSKVVIAPNPAPVLQDLAAAKVRRILARHVAIGAAQVIMSAGTANQRAEAGAILLALVARQS